MTTFYRRINFTLHVLYLAIMLAGLVGVFGWERLVALCR